MRALAAEMSRTLLPFSRQVVAEVEKRSFGLFSVLFQIPGCILLGLWGAPGHPFGPFSDSFGVPGPGKPCNKLGGVPKFVETP